MAEMDKVGSRRSRMVAKAPATSEKTGAAAVGGERGRALEPVGEVTQKRMTALIESAQRGDAKAMGELRPVLARAPGWEKDYTGPATQARRMLLEATLGDNLLVREAWERRALALQRELVDDWLVRPDAERKVVVGGWRLAAGARPRRRGAALSVAAAGGGGAGRGGSHAPAAILPLRDVAAQLPPAMHTLRTTLERAIAAWRAEADELSGGDEKQRGTAASLRDRLKLPLEEALRTGLLHGELGWFYTEAELDYLLPELSRVVMQPLRKQLDALGLGDPDQPIALVAGGRLGALPLHAASVHSAGKGKNHQTAPFQETCELSYQASARTLRTARDAAQALPTNGPFLTVGDPPTSHIPLPSARREAEEIAHLARQVGRTASRALLGEKATFKTVTDLLRTIRSQYPGAWVDIASHGNADLADPTKCYMLLAHNDLLTLALLQRERILAGVRCFGAAGCVTSVGDLETAPDELGSFAAGVQQAGAASAIATQWSVSDEATYLLMLRFAREALEHPNWTPARALREAAKWLRGATEEELSALQVEARKGLHTVKRGGDAAGDGESAEPSAADPADVRRDALRGVPTRDASATVEAAVEAEEGQAADELRATRSTRSARREGKRPFEHAIFWAAAVVYGA